MSTFKRNRFRVEIDLGWESHFLLNHTKRQQLHGSFLSKLGVDHATSPVGYAFENFTESYGNLSLAGLTGRARLDF